MKVVTQMLIFDIDGVITNLEKEIVTEPLILDFIINILEKGQPIAFNTGRGIDWTIKTVLNPLINKINNKQILTNLFVVAESGGITAEFDQNGTLKINVDYSLKMPKKMEQKVKELVKQKYSETTRDEDKQTMITTKIKEGTPLEKYHQDQLKLVEDFKNLIKDFRMENLMKVDLSTIGTNILYQSAGKGKGTELILSWLAEKNFNPYKFIDFGDSESDAPMTEKLYEEKLYVEFVYVGEEKIDTSKYPFPIIIPQNKFEKGTLEYLQSLA